MNHVLIISLTSLNYILIQRLFGFMQHALEMQLQQDICCPLNMQLLFKYGNENYKMSRSVVVDSRQHVTDVAQCCLKSLLGSASPPRSVQQQKRCRVSQFSNRRRLSRGLVCVCSITFRALAAYSPALRISTRPQSTQSVACVTWYSMRSMSSPCCAKGTARGGEGRDNVPRLATPTDDWFIRFYTNPQSQYRVTGVDQSRAAAKR